MMKKISRFSFLRKGAALVLGSLVPLSIAQTLGSAGESRKGKSVRKRNSGRSGSMEVEFTLSAPSGLWGTGSPSRKVVEKRIVSNRKPCRSDSFLTERHLVVKAVDRKGRVLQQFSQLDPRTVHADHFLASGMDNSIGDEYHFNLNASLLVNLPNTSDIHEIEIYRPLWNGKSFDLSPLTTVKLPVKGLTTASSEFDKRVKDTGAAVVNVENLLYSGNSKDKVDIVIMGDGYTESQMELWRQDAQDMTDKLFEKEPFHSYRKYWNVHRIDIISPEEGAGWNKAWSKKNALGSYYNCAGIPRLLWLDTSHANRMISMVLDSDQQDIKIVLVNDKRYGGGGGSFATTSARSSSALPIVLHEIGHSFGGFADEYTYGNCSIPGIEPSAPNITIEENPDRVKWKHIEDAGLFEGARYCKKGVYRPYENSIMRSLSGTWGQLHAEVFKERILKLGVEDKKWGSFRKTDSTNLILSL